MKRKEALKKFGFVKRLKLPEQKMLDVVNHLVSLLKGSTNYYHSPLANNTPPNEILVDWDIIFDEKMHMLNSQLLDFELNQRKKFGPRSIQLPWVDRCQSILNSFKCQISNFNTDFFYTFPDHPVGILKAIRAGEVKSKIKLNTSSGLPSLTTKEKAANNLFENFDELLEREDPCMLYTRTAESSKTRNVWGYPFAALYFEMFFFFPLLDFMKTKYWMASVVSPDLVDIRMTEIIKDSALCGKTLYSVDFIQYDSSCRWQIIVKAFFVVKKLFAEMYHEFLDEICLRFYTIGIVTPQGIFRGKHGIPSGSNFTNVLGSLIQAGVALSNHFIFENKMLVCGDDGVYSMEPENVSKFEATWEHAGFNLGKDKCMISANCASFCQRFYHTDYEVNGLIGGIYPTYRAINRLIWLEKFTDLKKIGMSSKDYFGMRTLTILEQCKYHPLFEDLVRFVLEREKYALNVSEAGTAKYIENLAKGRQGIEELNEAHLISPRGVRDFASYQMIQKIIESEGYFDIVDFSDSDSEEEDNDF